MSATMDAKNLNFLRCTILFGLLVATTASWTQLHGGFAPPPDVPQMPSLPSTQQIISYKTDEDKSPLKFTSHTELVLVPVVVTNKRGEHVPHLEKEDFSLSENGDKQTISTFEEVVANTSPIKRAPSTPGVFTNSLDTGEQSKQLTIIALDAVNTPFLDQTRAREELIRFLADTVRSGSLTSLITINRNGIRMIHDFTTNPEVLIAALRKAKGEFHLTGVGETPEELADANATPDISQLASSIDEEATRVVSFAHEKSEFAQYQQSAAVASTMESLQHIARAYAGIPGRKALILATGSFPFNVDASSSGIVGAPLGLWESTLQALNQANIAVYPVDVRGLVNAGGPSAVFGSDSMGKHLQQDVALARQQATIATLETIGSMTGGKAFYNRNDLTQSFKEAANDSAAYYIVGYYLNHKNNKPGWRKLSVQVHKDDAHVRARSGFYVTQSMLDPEANRQLDKALALTSPLDYTALPLTVRMISNEPKGGKRKVGFEIVLPANTAGIDESDKNKYSLDFLGTAKTPEGKNLATFSQNIQGNLKPEHVAQMRESGVTYKNMMELPPGQYNLRFVVRDNISGRIGSVLAPVLVN